MNIIQLESNWVNVYLASVNGANKSSSPEFEPDNTNLRIIPDQSEEFTDRLGLWENVQQTFHLDLSDISFLILGSCVTIGGCATSIPATHRTIPVVHADVVWWGETTWWLTVHMDFVGSTIRI